MSLWRQLTGGLRVLARRDRADRDLDDEVRHFLEESADAYVEQGLPLEDARQAAHRDIGTTVRIREQVRDQGWEQVVATLLSDLRLAARTLRRTPVFTAIMVFVIALGSGAVTTVFSAMNAVVLRPLPGVGDADRLVAIRPARADGSSAEQGSYAYARWFRERSRTVTDVVAWGRVSLTVSTGAEGIAVQGNMVSAGYFDALRIRPAIGRFFLPDEVRTPGEAAVAVVSSAFWKSRLGGEPAAVGRSIIVNGMPYVVIGVAPAGFHGVYTGLRADAWVPVTMQPHLRPRASLEHGAWLWLFGRLADGVDRDAARHELSAIAAARAADLRLGPRAFDRVRVDGMTGLPNGEAGPLLAFMTLLLGGAALVLAIAGVNVAAMLSARYAGRARELAVRAALGAGRARLLRTILTEVGLLSLVGSMAGFLLAVGATAALERLPLPSNIPVALELSPDLRVLTFGIAVTLVGGLVFGLPPALRAAGRNLSLRLHDGSAGSGARRSFAGRVLIAGQLALSLVLLVAAGLFMRALTRGQQIDPGFDAANVTIASLEPEAWGYDAARARDFYSALRNRVAALPGVTAVSYTGRLPLMFGRSPDDITVGDTTVLPIQYASVDEDYFTVLRLPILLGRPFDRSDDERAPRVAIVNETLARRLAPDGNAVGRAFRFQDQVTTVVGIARDALYARLDEPTPSFAYFPTAQVWHPTQVLIVRTTQASNALAPAIGDAVRSIDPLLPRPAVTSLNRATAIVLLPHKVAALVTGVFGLVGLVLAAVGLYGLMAFSAGRRTREIGVRLALGARPGSVLAMMVCEGMRLAGAGIAIGLVLSALTARLIAGWLFDVSPLDLATFAAMSAVFIVVALMASYLPARGAAKADPLSALRTE